MVLLLNENVPGVGFGGFVSIVVWVLTADYYCRLPDNTYEQQIQGALCTYATYAKGFLAVLANADHLTRTPARNLRRWSDVCWDAVACEGSGLTRPAWMLFLEGL